MNLDSPHAWAETIPIPSAAALAGAISRRRHTLGVSQKSLAEKTGVAASVIRRLELHEDDVSISIVVLLASALQLDLELRPRGSKFTPRPPTKLDELGLSQNTMSALKKEGLTRVDQLGSATLMLALPELGRGSELYEIVCALNRHGVSLPTTRSHRIPSDRDREVLRLRIVDGMTLSELARQFGLKPKRIRQILGFFGLSGAPPAAYRRRELRAQRRQWGA
jgi:transcriptional regulator with XRE-family HTH domain